MFVGICKLDIDMETKVAKEILKLTMITFEGRILVDERRRG